MNDELAYATIAIYALRHCVDTPEIDKTQIFTWIKTNWDNFNVKDKRLLTAYVSGLFYNAELIKLGHNKQSLIEFMDLWTWIHNRLVNAEGLFDTEELKKELGE